MVGRLGRAFLFVHFPCQISLIMSIFYVDKCRLLCTTLFLKTHPSHLNIFQFSILFLTTIDCDTDLLISVAANLRTRSAVLSSWRSKTVPRSASLSRTFITGWSHISLTLRTLRLVGRTQFDTISRSISASRKSIKTRVR